MKTVLHKADSRGVAEHGWLHSRHTFSFARYIDRNRMGFGALRVINDDIVDPSAGFGNHSHDNMEIISVPLAGALRHQDSMGNTHVIKEGEVQVMSAGTGITHSEYNASATDPVNFLQIWVLPKHKDIEPRYTQKEFSTDGRNNEFQVVVSPDGVDGDVSINQDAWFSLADFDTGHQASYKLKADGNGIYVFVIEGEIEIAGQRLGRRDGMGITESNEVDIEAVADCQILIMEVPLQ